MRPPEGDDDDAGDEDREALLPDDVLWHVLRHLTLVCRHGFFFWLRFTAFPFFLLRARKASHPKLVLFFSTLAARARSGVMCEPPMAPLCLLRKILARQLSLVPQLAVRGVPPNVQTKETTTQGES